MKLLFENFDILAKAPGGVKKLREMILQLAVQGKLVPQDPNDEPASVLLEKIKKEKESLIKQGKIRKQKPLSPIKPEEIPFEIPKTWQWVRLGKVTNYAQTQKIESEYVQNSTWVLELEDIEKETSNIFKKLYFKEREFKSTKNVFYKNDVVYGKLRPYLDKVIVAEEDGVCSTEMIPFNGFGYILPFFLKWFLKSPYFINYANSSTHGMRMPRLGTEKALNSMLCLPPLNEQKRIVERVNALMALCDKLEKQQEAQKEKKLALNTATLHKLNQSTTKDDFNHHWNFVKNNFNLLYTTEENIKALKQTILQLAIKGKLTESWRKQNPNIEPASTLLEKIKKEKESLIKQGKIKKQKPLPPIKPEEIPYEIPKTWQWVRIKEISHDWGQKKPNSNFTYIDVSSINKEKGIISENIKFLNEKNAPSRARKIVKKDTLIYSTVRPYLLNIAIVETSYIPEPIASTAFAIMHFYSGISNKYVYHFLRSITFIEYVESKMIGMAYPAINDSNFFKGIVPIPPINEQKRIVERVDALMALCDKLEKQQEAQKEKISKYLLNSVINRGIANV